MYYDINKLRAVLKTHAVYLLTGDASKRAYLRGVKLIDADLHGAYLRGVKLIDADLHGAYLRDAEARHD